MMNTMISRNKNREKFEITGNWNIQSKRLKEKFPVLTDGDVKFDNGKTEDLLTKLGSRLHKNREEVIHIIRNVKSKKA